MCIRPFPYFLGCGHGWLDSGLGVEVYDEQKQRKLIKWEQEVCAKIQFVRSYEICGVCPLCCDGEMEGDVEG
jgi:hypothetical protein